MNCKIEHSYVQRFKNKSWLFCFMNINTIWTFPTCVPCGTQQHSSSFPLHPHMSQDFKKQIPHCHHPTSVNINRGKKKNNCSRYCKWRSLGDKCSWKNLEYKYQPRSHTFQYLYYKDEIVLWCQLYDLNKYSL